MMVSEAKILAFRSPSQDDNPPDVGCPELMEEDLIMELISPAVLEKYHRFMRIRLDPNLRDCPGAPGTGYWSCFLETLP